MGRVKRLLQRGFRRVAGVVSRDDLFEKAGERAPSSPLSGASGVAAAPVAESAEPSAAPVCRLVSLAGLREAMAPGGGWRVINHWATWCIGCVDELPELRELAALLPPGARVLGVSWDLFDPRGDEDDIVEHVANFSAGHQLSWGSLVLGADVVPDELFTTFGFGETTVPQTWLVDDAGTVRYKVEGLVERAHIEHILGLISAG